MLAVVVRVHPDVVANAGGLVVARVHGGLGLAGAQVVAAGKSSCTGVAVACVCTYVGRAQGKARRGDEFDDVVTGQQAGEVVVAHGVGDLAAHQYAG